MTVSLISPGRVAEAREGEDSGYGEAVSVSVADYSSANCSSKEQYHALHQQSLMEPNKFWNAISKDNLEWTVEPSCSIEDEASVQDFSTLSEVEWFPGGRINASVNCVDRWAARDPTKIALICEGDDHQNPISITYGDLHQRVCKLANVLKANGVGKGSNVGICLPSIWQAPVSMLACARLGAVHTVVFAGFSAQSLAERMISSQCTHLISCDVGMRGGKEVDLLSVILTALKLIDRPNFVTALFQRRTQGFTIPDDFVNPVISLDDQMKSASTECVPEQLKSSDPFFILHTSGSTGAPKGLTHRVGPYLAYVAMTMKFTFDIEQSDIFCCVADVGWITGHSYVTYGPLLMGATTILFESLPTFPTPYRFWDMIKRHNVTKFYTTPTATRILAGMCSPEQMPEMPSLKLIGSVGESLGEETWKWLFTHVGKEKCPIVDTYWQTECGGHVIVSPPGTNKFYPGAAGLPMLSIQPVLMDFDTGKEIKDVNRVGALCISKPWPGLFRQSAGASLEKWFGQFPGLYFTGDSAMWVATGYLKICGRIDDGINVNGHLFGSGEFETALMESGLIRDAAAVGIDHDVKGQAVCAFVCVSPGAALTGEVLAQRLRAQVRKAIGPIAVIDKIFIIEDLPKTRSGKVVRRLLRQAASHQFGALAEADKSTLTDATVVEHLMDVAKMAAW